MKYYLFFVAKPKKREEKVLYCGYISDILPLSKDSDGFPYIFLFIDASCYDQFSLFIGSDVCGIKEFSGIIINFHQYFHHLTSFKFFHRSVNHDSPLTKNSELYGGRLQILV